MLQEGDNAANCDYAGNQQKGNNMDVPDNVIAYKLYSNGLTPIQVVSELRIPEADAIYYIEYLRLKRLPGLTSVIGELKMPEKIALFIKLTNLALAENMRANQVLQPWDGECTWNAQYRTKYQKLWVDNNKDEKRKR